MCNNDVKIMILLSLLLQMIIIIIIIVMIIFVILMLLLPPLSKLSERLGFQFVCLFVGMLATTMYRKHETSSTLP